MIFKKTIKKNSGNSIGAKEKKDRNKKRLVEVWEGPSLRTAEYDPDKEYGLYRSRYGVSCDHTDSINFIMCSECKEHDCGLCRVEDIATKLRSQEEEVNRRKRRLEEMTTQYRESDDNLDEEWMKQQDPVMAKLIVNNKEMEDDIHRYLAQIDNRVKAVKKELGWSD